MSVSPHCQTQKTIRRPRICVDARAQARLGNRIPCAVIRLKANLSDGGNFGKHFLPNLVDDFLYASRFESGEHALHDPARLTRYSAAAASDAIVYISPVQVQPHMQWPVVNVGERCVLIAHEAC